jgi:hypothetical protein
VFNVSTANFKELDKTQGSIQKLHNRDNDILVLQEEKASKVFFEKDVLFNSDGSSNLTSTNKVLGSQSFYLGENGIGKNPESFAVNDFQVYYTNSNKGIVHRLSIDGVTPIVDHMTDFFRDLFRNNNSSLKIGGFDPYTNQYVLSVLEEPYKILKLNCNNSILKSNLIGTFLYELQLNDLEGDIIISYNITNGNGTIIATYESVPYVASNVTGLGNITIPRNDIEQKIVSISITNVSESIDIELFNICPVGKPLKVIEIVINSSEQENLSITNKYKTNQSNYFQNNDTFLSGPITRYEETQGIEGVGKCPRNGDTIRIESYKSSNDNGNFDLSLCNRIGYLISSNQYTELDFLDIIDNANYLSLTKSDLSLISYVHFGNFVFQRNSNDENLYLIWDYRDNKPIVNNDVMNAIKGDTVILDIINNDIINGEDTIITIESGPNHGSIIINPDNTISYTHDDSATTEDSFNYSIFNGVCSSSAEVTLIIEDTTILPLYPYYYEGRWECPDELHHPEINSWVKYRNQYNNIITRYGFCVGECEQIMANEIIETSNVNPCNI